MGDGGRARADGPLPLLHVPKGARVRLRNRCQHIGREVPLGSRRGAIRLYESHPGSHRGFCSRCGSVVPGVSVSNEGRVFISVGCLDDDPGTGPVAHIFIASKAPWQEITDDLPQHEEYPTSSSRLGRASGPFLSTYATKRCMK